MHLKGERLRKDETGAYHDRLRLSHHAFYFRILEREVAKSEKRRARWTKPKQGKMEKATPRPKKPEIEGSDGEDERQADEHEQSDDDDDAMIRSFDGIIWVWESSIVSLGRFHVLRKI